MAFKKRRTYKKKSFSKKRKYSKKRKTTKKRSYLKSKRSKKSSKLSHVTAPTMRLNVIPKTADRLHVKLNYKTRGLLDWRGTAERHIGMCFLPTYLGINSVNKGPFQLAWPNAGTNVNFVSAVATTPGFLTLVSRFTEYYVTSVSINVRVTRQEAVDSTTCVIGMMPLTAAQFVRLFIRNTALSPTANNSFWLPNAGDTATTVATTQTYEQQLMMIKQQPYVKMAQVQMPYSGKQFASLHQRYSAKKFSAFGYPYGPGFSGTLPAITASDGTPPTQGFQHYFFMHNTGPGAGDEKFDIDMDMTIHATFHRPTFVQTAPTFEESKEEKVDEKTDEPEEVEEDLVDMSSLSLMSPKPSQSSLERAPTLILKTCLNSSHPNDPHKVVDSCV